jgi:hypothetical protein
MVLRALAIIISLAVSPAAFAQQEPCGPAAFREAVATAGATISGLHEKNAAIFQENLRKLRVANNWQEAEYLANAAPFVKDDTIASLDSANQTLLTEVRSLDASNATSDSGRCAMLAELKLAMQKVVANTAAKWDHMQDKLGRASMQPIQAGFSR